MRRRGLRVNLSRPGRLVVVVVGSLEFPRGEAPQVKVELVQARVVAVMGELNLELELVAAHGPLANDAAGADARASPRAIRSLGGHLAGLDRCTSLLAENTFVWHLGLLTRRATTDEGPRRIPGERIRPDATGPDARLRQTQSPLVGKGSVPPCPYRASRCHATLRRSRTRVPRRRLPVSDRDLCFTPAALLHRLYRSRKTSPLEVMRAVLERVDAVNSKLNAIVTLERESALKAARTATAALKKGKKLGPLHGVPVTIKDLTHTKGIRTTWGSKVFEHHVPDEDSLIVERLKGAGAIVIGKTNTPEFGAGGNTFNAVFGATRNPWNPALTCGGSSGGAAVALATGMGPLAQGSDLGGSLRMPAAFCGVVGFRTS